jgi:hypothetical protein
MFSVTSTLKFLSCGRTIRRASNPWPAVQKYLGRPIEHALACLPQGFGPP